MARRRSRRSRGTWPVAVLACVVILLGTAVYRAGGWPAVAVAVVFSVVMSLLTSRRSRRRRGWLA